MRIIISPPFNSHCSEPAQYAGVVSDQPPGIQFVSEFFAGHKGKIMAVGVGAILAGLGLIVVDIFSAGVVAPFTAHLVFGLFSFGAAAIGVSVAGKFLSGELSGQPNKPPGSAEEKPVVKPRGRRCHRVFQIQVPKPPKPPAV